MGKKLKSDETLYTGETLRGGEREVTEARRASPETCLATRVMIVRPAGCNRANELRCVDWMLKTERRRVIADAAFGGDSGKDRVYLYGWSKGLRSEPVCDTAPVIGREEHDVSR